MNEPITNTDETSRLPWRGGPDIGTYAEWEYALEQADYDG